MGRKALLSPRWDSGGWPHEWIARLEAAVSDDVALLRTEWLTTMWRGICHVISYSLPLLHVPP